MSVTITLEQYIEYDDSLIGVCRECGSEREMTESDARKYPCEQCGENAVYGAGEFLVEGLVD
tara:strand:- start:644 stop:829 length:186 start_codon:yes stop_codon:yes gene_type:complete